MNGEVLRRAQAADTEFRPTVGVGEPLQPAHSVARLVVLVYALVAAYLGFCLIARAMILHVSVNSNEGWNAGLALRLFHGEALYPDIRTFIGNNYPPISFVLTSLLMHFVPDPILAGRILSTIGFLAIPVMIYALLRQIGCLRYQAVLGSTIFPAYMIANVPYYVAVNDPQVEAYPLMLGAALVILRRAPRLLDIVLAAFLVTVAMFVKHNVIGIVMAMSLWLLVTRPRMAIAFAASGAVFTLLSGLICYQFFGHLFFDNIFSPREYSLLLSWRSFYGLNPALLLIAALALTILELARPDNFTYFFKSYLLFAMLVGIVTSSGDGVGANAYFEVPLAAGPGLAYSLRNLPALNRRPWSSAVLATIFAACSLMGPSLSTTKDMLQFKSWFALQRAREAAALPVVDYLAKQPGPVLCQITTYCVWAGKGIGAVAPFNFLAAVQAGQISDAAVVRRINDHVYAAIVVPLPGDDSALTPSITQAMHASYKRLDIPGALVAVLVPNAGE